MIVRLRVVLKRTVVGDWPFTMFKLCYYGDLSQPLRKRWRVRRTKGCRLHWTNMLHFTFPIFFLLTNCLPPTIYRRLITASIKPRWPGFYQLLWPQEPYYREHRTLSTTADSSNHTPASKPRFIYHPTMLHFFCHFSASQSKIWGPSFLWSAISPGKLI